MPYDVSSETIDPAPATAPVIDAKKSARMKRRRKVLLLGFAALIAKVAVGAGAYWMIEGSHVVSTENAYVGASTAQVSSLVSGRLLEVHVEDTEFVRAGAVLARIDPEDAALNLARAEADYRRTLQRVRQYYAQESALVAQMQAREAELARAATDFARRSKLAATGAVSGEELTAARSVRDAADANLAAARETLEAQRELTRGESVEKHPETASARAALDAARLAFERTVIRAPIDGVVTQRSVQIGQRVEIGQRLMIIAPINEAFVDANFKEGQLGRVRPGQEVELISDLYGEDVVFHGRVEGLGGGTGSAFAVIPAQNATGNWIKVVQRVPVRISLDPKELAAHPLRIGLSMEARIDLRAKAK